MAMSPGKHCSIAEPERSNKNKISPVSVPAIKRTKKPVIFSRSALPFILYRVAIDFLSDSSMDLLQRSVFEGLNIVKFDNYNVFVKYPEKMKRDIS